MYCVRSVCVSPVDVFLFFRLGRNCDLKFGLDINTYYILQCLPFSLFYIQQISSRAVEGKPRTSRSRGGENKDILHWPEKGRVKKLSKTQCNRPVGVTYPLGLSNLSSCCCVVVAILIYLHDCRFDCLSFITYTRLS